MDVMEAIAKRRSIRGFTSDPVPAGLLREILETSVRAPSALNSQPWEFAVITGRVLDRIRQANVERLYSEEASASGPSALPWPRYSVYRRRQVELGKALFQLMGISREDQEKRKAWRERGFRFFDAPVAIIVMADRVLPEASPLLDIGLVVENICLAALARGLGTCIEDQGIYFPDVLYEHAGIPESKRPVIAIAAGYPDWDFPANKLQSSREPAENLTTWIGFS
ncbi:MAG: nitroreductase [Desulfosalsimonadaceae bacterium]